MQIIKTNFKIKQNLLLTIGRLIMLCDVLWITPGTETVDWISCWLEGSWVDVMVVSDKI